jgi:hypothetical protein
VSTAFGVTFIPPKNFRRISQSIFSFSVRLIEKTALSALKSVPSWNLTPSLSLKRQVLGSIRSQDSASRGVMLPSSGSISVNVSVMFCLTIRPTFDRLA